MSHCQPLVDSKVNKLTNKHWPHFRFDNLVQVQHVELTEKNSGVEWGNRCVVYRLVAHLNVVGSFPLCHTVLNHRKSGGRTTETEESDGCSVHACFTPA